MKKLYEFTVSKKEEVEKSEVTKNSQGEEVTVKRKVSELVPKRFFLRKPSRDLYEEAELHYNVTLHAGIRAGLLTNALLAKRYANDGGVLSEGDKNELAGLYLQLFDAQTDFQKLSTIPDGTITEEEKLKLDETKKYIIDLRRQIQEYELAQNSLYDHTAENRARNKTIYWWVMHLSYRENDKGEPEPMFGEGNLSARLDAYDEIEESNDEFLKDVLKRFLYFVSFWYVGRAKTQEEFEKLAATLTAQNEPAKT